MNPIHAHFKKNDPILYSFMGKIGALDPIEKERPDKYFFRLCREIIGQQLSSASSDAIIKRFEAYFGNTFPNPSDIFPVPHETLRAIGMSNAKARYVRNLAEAVVKEEIHLHALDDMSDEQVVTELTKVKGIGPWTAEMFLIFVLGRPDVFSFGDLGLKKGMKIVYGLKKDPTEKQIKKIIAPWSPYKTYASRILWQSLEL